MIYAIVTEYTDGHNTIQLIENKAPAATKTNSCVQRFIEKGVLHIRYPAEFHPEREHHIFEDAVITIPLDGVKTITLHNVDGDTIDPVSPFRSAYPIT